MATATGTPTTTRTRRSRRPRPTGGRPPAAARACPRRAGARCSRRTRERRPSARTRSFARAAARGSRSARARSTSAGGTRMRTRAARPHSASAATGCYVRRLTRVCGRPSDRVAGAERRLRLVNDPQAADVRPDAVVCACCSSEVKLAGPGTYDTAAWDAHKAGCPPPPPRYAACLPQCLHVRMVTDHVRQRRRARADAATALAHAASAARGRGRGDDGARPSAGKAAARRRRRRRRGRGRAARDTGTYRSLRASPRRRAGLPRMARGPRPRVHGRLPGCAPGRS
jgi:hypothetical protein